MGAYAYLELRPKRSLLNPFRAEKALFSRKSEVPFAWYLLFSPDDFEPKTGVLAAEVSLALKRARARVDALKPRSSDELASLLDAFLERLAKEKATAELVLNAAELELSKSQLTAPAKWCASLEGKQVTKKLIERGKALFDEGLDWDFADDDGDPIWLDVDDAELTLGFATGAKDPEPKRKVEEIPKTRASTAELEQALAAVRAQPFELAPRLVYADALSAAGDPRGEFILLSGKASSLTPKQAKRLGQLRAELWPELSAPFGPAELIFESGFAAQARFDRPPATPIPNPEAWKTVHTLQIRGGADALTDPAFQNVRRVTLSAADLIRLIELRSRVPFWSVCLADDPPAAAWHALRMTEYFPALLEVCVEVISVWLPEGGKQLVESRPELHLRRWPLPIVELAPLTPEQQRLRRARWDAPAQGAQLPGARYDDKY